jgi:hypothetical protein
MTTENTSWMNQFDDLSEEAVGYDWHHEKLDTPSLVLEALIAMRANAHTLIEHGASKEVWAIYEDALIRHCQVFIERTKEWKKKQ